MKKDSVFSDKRLLSAIDYIDSGLISEAMGALKIQDAATPSGSNRSGLRRTVIQTLVLAACLIMLSAAVPIVNYVIKYTDLGAGWAGTETSETTNGMYDKYVLTEDDLAQLNDAWIKYTVSASYGKTELDEAELEELRKNKYCIYAETVEQAMHRPSSRPLDGGKCYIGKYGDCIVVVTISNSSLGLSSDQFWACYSSELYMLEDAHQKGYVNDDELEKIYDFYDSLGISELTYVKGAYLLPIKDLEPLPQGLLEEIDSKSEVGFSSFSVLNRGITRSDRYLGYIGGYYVFFETSAGDRPGYYTAATFAELHVAGYDFYYNTPFSILLHRDGVNITLKEAYESGQITLENVRKIYCRNNEYIRYFNPEWNFKDKVPITEEEFNEIRNAWITKFNESEHFPKEFEWTFGRMYSCYGHIGGNIIFLAGNPEFDGVNEWVDFEIEGYPFSVFLKPMNIWVYRDGEIVLLQDAYDRGLIASEDLPTISYMNQLVWG